MRVRRFVGRILSLRYHYEMRPQVEHIAYSGSLSCRRFAGVAFDCPWHLHPEVEILRIDRGVGDRLIGDCLGRYGPGDVYVLASQLPHLFLTDPAPSPATGRAATTAADPAAEEGGEGGAGAWGSAGTGGLAEAGAETEAGSVSRYIQFGPEAFGESFFGGPEMSGAAGLFRRAKRGLQLTSGPGVVEVERAFDAVFAASGLRRVGCLLGLLAALAEAPALPLASVGYGGRLARLMPAGSDPRAVSRAIELIHERSSRPLSLPSVAESVGMSPGGFSRAFRRATGLSFTDYLLDLRVQEACRRLMETSAAVIEVCYASGFANLSNFNRQFRKRRGMTPSAFRRRSRSAMQWAAAGGRVGG